jgi:hypothetical protein
MSAVAVATTRWRAPRCAGLCAGDFRQAASDPLAAPPPSHCGVEHLPLLAVRHCL